MAHKKSGGSSTNGRESAGRRLGFKRYQGQEVIIGNGQFPLEVVGHSRQHTLITRCLIVSLQCPKHRHLGPEVRRVRIAVSSTGTQFTVGFQVSQYCLEPHLSLLLHHLIV